MCQILFVKSHILIFNDHTVFIALVVHSAELHIRVSEQRENVG